MTLSGSNPLLTVAGAARLLGVHANTVRAWTDQGRLTCLRMNARGDRRYRPEELERFLRESRFEMADPPAATGPRPRGVAKAATPDASLAIVAATARLCSAGDDLAVVLPQVAALLAERAGYEAATYISPDGSGQALVGSIPVDRRLIRAAERRPGDLVCRSDAAAGTTSVAFALGSQARRAGVVVMRRPLTGGPRPHEADLMTALAAQLNAVVAATRGREALDERRRRAELLLAVGGDIASQLDLPRMMNQLIDHAMELFDADHAAVLRKLPTGGFEMQVGRNMSSAFRQIIEHASSLPLTALAFDSRTVVSATDYPDDPRAVALRPALLREGINTVTVAPLLSDGGPLGTLALYHDQRYIWNEEDLRLFEQLANQGAAVLKSARDYGQMATWAAQLQSIQQLGARLTRLTSVREIGLAIATELNQLIDYHNVRVYRIDGEQCVPVAWRGEVGEYESEDGEQLRIAVGQGITGWVARYGLAQNLGDAAKDKRAETIPGTEDDLDESLLLAPMIYEDEVIGVIVLAKLGLNQFTADDMRLLEIYASIAAQAMANADGTERLQAQSATLARQLKGQRALLSVTESILGTLDTQALLEEIAVRLGTLLQVDNVSVDMHDEEAQLLRPLFARGIHAAEYLGRTLADSKGVASYVLRSGEALLVRDELADGRVVHIDATGPKPGAMIVAPLRGHNRVTGLLTIERLGQDASFGEEEFELVKLFAAHVSIALQNAERHHAVELRAQTDALTGLKNHGSLSEHLARAVEVGSPFALLMIDLDDFKLYNDQRGHQAGNEMLQGLAGVLRAACRDADDVFRYGGDEFAILLPGTSPAGALTVAQVVGAEVRAATNGRGPGPSITCSIGVAAFPEDGKDVAGIVLAADLACYAAKRAGRDRVATAAQGLELAAEFEPGLITPVDEPETAYPAA